MGLLHLTPARCVRALSVNSACNDCAVVCPTNAVSLEGRLPAINHSHCVGCNACAAVCPTEALVLEDFSATEFFFSFAAEAENTVSCQKNVPCLGALSDEHLIALAKLKKNIILDTGHCGSCEIGETILQRLQQRVENITYLLEAVGSENALSLVPLGYVDEADTNKDEAHRRDFFRHFHLKGIAKAKVDFEKEVQKATDEFVECTIGSFDTQGLRTKKITDRRKLFFTALKRTEKPETYHVVSADAVSFTSQKLLDEAKCTACEMCYRVCPTGALTSDMRNSKIDFDPFLCVKCHLCHDVCESGAISLSTSYNLKEWYEPSLQNLVTFSVRRCDECNGLFSSVGGEKICRRCRLEEEEAMELWGLNS